MIRRYRFTDFNYWKEALQRIFIFSAVIKKIATQGKLGAYQWVGTYTLSSRANGDTDWVTYKENDDEKVSHLSGIWYI